MKCKTVIPDGYEIDVDKSTFEEIVFKKLSSKYPLSVKDVEHRRPAYINKDGEVMLINDDVDNHDINNVSSVDRAYAFLALMQLVELRDAWNKIDGNMDFEYNETNHCIYIEREVLRVGVWSIQNKVLHFRSRDTANLFRETFRDLIEQAKELI